MNQHSRCSTTTSFGSSPTLNITKGDGSWVTKFVARFATWAFYKLMSKGGLGFIIVIVVFFSTQLFIIDRFLNMGSRIIQPTSCEPSWDQIHAHNLEMEQALV